MNGSLESVGGAAYIAGLLDDCLPESAEVYADIVIKSAEKRRLLNALEIAKSKVMEGVSVEQIMAEIGMVMSSSQRATIEPLGHTYEQIVNAKPVSFAIDGFLQEFGVTLIGGLSGHGKTFIMLAIAKALLEGGKLFHHFNVNVPASKVIYLIPECSLEPFSHRLKISGLTSHVKPGRLIVRTLSMKPIELDDSRLLREAPGADIFLDTVTRFKSGDENDAAENNQFADAIFKLQRAGARTVIGAHHSPKSFVRETVMTLENILRGSGDIGAMIATCWGVRQIDPERNRIFVANVKPRDFQPCKPFIIQGRPSLNESGCFDLAEPPGFAGELADHVSKDKEKGGRPAIETDKVAAAFRLKSEGKSIRDIASELRVGKSSVDRWLREAE
jgi:AAA domain